MRCGVAGQAEVRCSPAPAPAYLHAAGAPLPNRSWPLPGCSGGDLQVCFCCPDPPQPPRPVGQPGQAEGGRPHTWPATPTTWPGRHRHTSKHSQTTARRDAEHSHTHTCMYITHVLCTHAVTHITVTHRKLLSATDSPSCRCDLRASPCGLRYSCVSVTCRGRG